MISRGNRSKSRIGKICLGSLERTPHSVFDVFLESLKRDVIWACRFRANDVDGGVERRKREDNVSRSEMKSI